MIKQVPHPNQPLQAFIMTSNVWPYNDEVLVVRCIGDDAGGFVLTLFYLIS